MVPQNLVLTHCGIGVDLSNPSTQRTFLTIQRTSDNASLIIDLEPEAMNRIIEFAEGGAAVQVAPTDELPTDDDDFPRV